MTKSKPEWEMHKARTRRAKDALREGKLRANERARLLVKQELAALETALDFEIRAAVEANVPKTQLAKESLYTSSLNAIYDSLKRTEGTHIDPNTPGHVSANTDPNAGLYALTTEGHLRITPQPQANGGAAQELWDTLEAFHGTGHYTPADYAAEFRVNPKGQLELTNPELHSPAQGRFQPLTEFFFSPGKGAAAEQAAVAWYRENAAHAALPAAA